MEKIILFAPLIGAIIAGFGWRQIGEKGAMYVTTGLLFLACLLSWIVFLNLGQEHSICQSCVGLKVAHLAPIGPSAWTD